MYKFAFVLVLNGVKIDYLRKYEMSFYIKDERLLKMIQYDENNVAYMPDDVNFNKAEICLEQINEALVCVREGVSGSLVGKMISKPKFKHFQPLVEIVNHTL